MSARTFIVHGRPVPQGSLRPIPLKSGRVVMPQSRDVLAYRADIHEAWGEPDITLRPVSVSIRFTFKRPKSHFKGEALRSEFVEARHTGKPDIDKLSRAVLDALTGYAFSDDSQVVELNAEKIWSNTGTEWTGITLTHL